MAMSVKIPEEVYDHVFKATELSGMMRHAAQSGRRKETGLRYLDVMASRDFSFSLEIAKRYNSDAERVPGAPVLTAIVQSLDYDLLTALRSRHTENGNHFEAVFATPNEIPDHDVWAIAATAGFMGRLSPEQAQKVLSNLHMSVADGGRLVVVDWNAGSETRYELERHVSGAGFSVVMNARIRHAAEGIDIVAVAADK
jgi:hypothetical protein